MIRFAGRLRRAAAVVLVLSSIPTAAAAADQTDLPTHCTNLDKMRAVLARFAPPNSKVYLPTFAGQDISATNPADPLLNHWLDFLFVGYNHRVDPRFVVAVAAPESTFGTNPKGEKWLKNDNPFGISVQNGAAPMTFASLGGRAPNGAIDYAGGYFEHLIYNHMCTRIAMYAAPPATNFCGKFAADATDAGRQNWIDHTKYYYGRAQYPRPNMNLGGDPETNDLSFGCVCGYGACNGAGSFCPGGDCTATRSVNVGDILTMLNIATGIVPVSDCFWGANDANCAPSTGGVGDAASITATGIVPDPTCGSISVIEIMRAVIVGMNGPGDPSPLSPLSGTPPPDPCAPDPSDPCVDCTRQCQTDHCGTEP